MISLRAGRARALAVLAALLVAIASSPSRADMAVSAADLESFFSLPTESLTDLGNGPAVNGSGIWTSLLVQAGDTLSFRYNFLTNEVNDLGNTINDFAFLAIGSSIIPFADVVSLPLSSSSAPGFMSETGFQDYSYTFTSGGSVLVGLGVVNVTDNTFDSGILLDNFMLGSSLITNGGLETGDFTGFSRIGDSRVVGLFGGSPPGGQYQALLTTGASAVPEPSSLALLGLGAASLLSRLRHRSRRFRMQDAV